MFDDLPGPVPANLPEGLAYATDFLSRDEEAALIRALPLQAAIYKQYSARRRVVSFGGSYDYDATSCCRPSP